jgi:hypothetical protein
LIAPFSPLLGSDRESHVVFPATVYLQIALGDAFAAQVELLDDSATRGVARNDRDLQSVKLDFLEGEASDNDECF